MLTVPLAGAAPTIREAGVIRLPKGDSLESRLVELETNLLELLHGFHPRILACEALYAHYKHPRTAILMGHARGVILVAAARCGLEVVSVAATNAKKLLTGSGHATKAQVQRAIAHTLGLLRPPEPNDVADAIAIALCGLRLHEARAISDPPVRERVVGESVVKKLLVRSRRAGILAPTVAEDSSHAPARPGVTLRTVRRAACIAPVTFAASSAPSVIENRKSKIENQP